MFDIDGGYDMDFDSGISESFNGYAESLDDTNCSALECVSDISELFDEAEIEESLYGMEDPIGEHVDLTDQFPSLSEYDDIIEQSDSIEELESIRIRLEDGEYVSGETDESSGEMVELSALDDIEPELTLPSEIVQELYEENEDNPSFGEKLDELVSSGRVSVSENEEETNESESDDIKVLTREITPEILGGRDRDTEEMLDNYRENLQERGVSEERIEEFIENERESINEEYESLENGNISENIYQIPTDWDSVSEQIGRNDIEIDIDSGISEIVDGEDSGISERNLALDNSLFEEVSEETSHSENETVNEVQELSVDYDEIYEGISREALAQGFEEIDIYEDSERLDHSLENFVTENWVNMSMDDQKQSMNNLAEYVEEVIGFKDPPKIEYYNNPREGDYGGYNSRTNTLSINEFMLYNNSEAADTVAHELWHAYQHECADNPSSARDYQYQYNFENYIRPEMGHEAYENQLIEAEARAFAAQFKGRIDELSVRRQ